MKVIQTLADVQSLKNDERLPSFYVEEISNQFLWTYEAVAEGEAIDNFLLAPQACLYHFSEASDWRKIEEMLRDIEYIDTEVVEGKKYFRIGIMQEHEVS